MPTYTGQVPYYSDRTAAIADTVEKPPLASNWIYKYATGNQWIYFILYKAGTSYYVTPICETYLGRNIKYFDYEYNNFQELNDVLQYGNYNWYPSGLSVDGGPTDFDAEVTIDLANGIWIYDRVQNVEFPVEYLDCINNPSKVPPSITSFTATGGSANIDINFSYGLYDTSTFTINYVNFTFTDLGSNTDPLTFYTSQNPYTGVSHYNITQFDENSGTLVFNDMSGNATIKLSFTDFSGYPGLESNALSDYFYTSELTHVFDISMDQYGIIHWNKDSVGPNQKDPNYYALQLYDKTGNFIPDINESSGGGSYTAKIITNGTTINIFDISAMIKPGEDISGFFYPGFYDNNTSGYIFGNPISLGVLTLPGNTNTLSFPNGVQSINNVEWNNNIFTINFTTIYPTSDQIRYYVKIENITQSITYYTPAIPASLYYGNSVWFQSSPITFYTDADGSANIFIYDPLTDQFNVSMGTTFTGTYSGTYLTSYTSDANITYTNGVFRTGYSYPDVPTDLTVNSVSDHLELSWTEPSAVGIPNNNGGDISSYWIHVSTDNFSTVDISYNIQPGSSTIYNIGNPGDIYYFKIRAVNRYGTSGFTNTVNEIYPSHPAAPVPDQTTHLEVIQDISSLKLTWTQPNDNGEHITGYNIKVSTDGFTSDNKSYHIEPTDTTYFTETKATEVGYVLPLPWGQLFNFKVNAFNANGDGLDSLPAEAYFPTKTPGIPTLFNPIPGNHNVQLEIIPSEDTGGEGPLHYRIDISTNLYNYDISSTTINPTITDLSNGTLYSFIARAYNTNGYSDYSNLLTATPATVPSAPRFTDVSYGDSIAYLNWTVDDNGGSAIIQYSIESNPPRTPQIVFENFAILGGLVNGQEYTFTVNARNGVDYGPYSDPSEPIIPSTIPQPPQDVTVPIFPAVNATSGNQKCYLTWIPQGIPDNGYSEILYYLISTPGLPDLSSNKPEGTFFTGLTNGTPYIFQIRSVNANGISDFSPQSNLFIPSTIPEAPILNGYKGDNKLYIYWTPANNGGDNIVSYTLNYTIEGNPTDVIPGLAPIYSLMNPYELTLPPNSNGKSVLVSVFATNGNGNGPASTPITLIPSTTPSVPQHLIASSDVPLQATLTWSPPTDNGGAVITGYTTYIQTQGNVQVADASSFNPIEDFVGLTKTYYGLPAGQFYNFWILAHNSNGTSNPTPTGIPTVRPYSVQNVLLTPKYEHAVLTWSDLSNNLGVGDIYEIVFNTNPPNGTMQIDYDKDLSFNITGLTAGLSQEATITVKSNGIDSDPIQSNFAIPYTVPDTLTIASTNRGANSGEIVSSFVLPVNTGGDEINRFKYSITDIFAAPPLQVQENVIDISDNSVDISDNGLGGPDFYYITMSDLSNGKTYQVRFKALNNAYVEGGEPDYSNVTNLTQAIPGTIPGLPLLTDLSSYDSSGYVAWNPPEWNGGYDVSYYYVTITTGGTPIHSGPQAVTYREIMGPDISNGYTYNISIQSGNDVGLSIPLTVELTPSRVPDAPTITNIEGGFEHATLTWTAPYNGGADIIYYTIECSDNNISDISANSSATSKVITGLTNGNPYSFRIKARNIKGFGEFSEFSNVVIPSGSATIPDTPDKPTITPGNQQLIISWSPPAFDGGSEIIYYVLQNVNGFFADLSFNSSILTTTITGLTNNIKYEYKLKAGNSVGPSLWSEIEGGTPVAPPVPGIVPKPVLETGDSRLKLYWSTPDNIATVPVLYYEIDCSFGHYSDISENGSNTTHIFTDASNLHPYAFSVRGVGSNGPGPWSEFSDIRYPTSAEIYKPLIKRFQYVENLNDSNQNYLIAGCFAIYDYNIPSEYYFIYGPQSAKSDLSSNLYSLTVNDMSDNILANINPNLHVIKGSTKSNIPYSFNNIQSSSKISDKFFRVDGPKGFSMVSDNVFGIVALSNLDSFVFSDFIETTKAIITFPSKPKMDKITTGHNSISIKWTDISNGGTDLTIVNYNIKDDDGLQIGNELVLGQVNVGVGELVLANQVNISGQQQIQYPIDYIIKYNSESLIDGSSYKVNMSTGNPLGASTFTDFSFNIIPKNSLAPSAPLLNLSAINDNVTLTWSDVSDGGSEITKYTLFTANGIYFNDVSGFINTGTNLSYDAYINFVDKIYLYKFDISNNTQYTYNNVSNGSHLYFIASENSNGGAFSDIKTISVSSGTAPEKPQTPTLVKGNGQATLTWIAPFDGGSSILYYTIDCSDSRISDISANSSSTSKVIDLSNGNPYSFRIKANNTIGDSLYSEFSNIVIPSTTPSAPTITGVIPGNQEITINWTEPYNGGADISGYKLNTYDSLGNLLSSNSFGYGMLTVTKSGLTNGTVYKFKILAYNIDGDGALSSFSSLVTPYTTPSTIITPTLTAGNGQATLTWSTPDNGGSTILRYNIKCSDVKIADISANNLATSRVITDLSNGNPYSFSIAAVNTAGSGTYSELSNIVTPSTTPSAPTITFAVPGPGGGEATVTWTDSFNGGSDISYYRFKTYTSANVLVSDISFGYGVNIYTKTGLTPATIYKFNILAHNKNGDGTVSAYSSLVTPYTVPGAPTIGTLVKGDQQATLSWTAPVSNGGSPILYYNIDCSDSRIADISANNLAINKTITDLSNGNTYSFRVQAVNAAGGGSYSAFSSSAIPSTVPYIPTITDISYGNTTAILSWTAPFNGGSSITYYTIDTSNNAIADISANATATSRTITGLTNGTTYTFRIKANNANGSGTYSDFSNEITPSTIPGIPTISSLVEGNTEATLTWTAPSNGGSSILYYSIDCSDSRIADISANGSATSQIVTDLSNGNTYSFRLKAINRNGEGTYSSFSSSVVPSTVPEIPTITDLTGGNNQATLTWTAPYNGGSAILHYIIDCSDSRIADISANGSVTSKIITDLSNGNTYHFAIKAYNINGYGSYSEFSSGVTPANNGPSAPQNFQTDPSFNSIKLTWEAPASGAPFTGYTIYRDGSNKVDVSSNVLTYTYTGLESYQDYSFEISAKNANGNGTSATKTEKTLPFSPKGDLPPGQITYPILINGSVQVFTTQNTANTITSGTFGVTKDNRIFTRETLVMYVDKDISGNNGLLNGLLESITSGVYNIALKTSETGPSVVQKGLIKNQDGSDLSIGDLSGNEITALLSDIDISTNNWIFLTVKEPSAVDLSKNRILNNFYFKLIDNNTDSFITSGFNIPFIVDISNNKGNPDVLAVKRYSDISQAYYKITDASKSSGTMYQFNLTTNSDYQIQQIVPDPPTNISLSQVSNYVYVSYTPPVFTGPSGEQISDYKVYWTPSNKFQPKKVAVGDISNNKIMIPALNVGTEYTVNVVAININGESTYSETKKITPTGQTGGVTGDPHITTIYNEQYFLPNINGRFLIFDNDKLNYNLYITADCYFLTPDEINKAPFKSKYLTNYTFMRTVNMKFKGENIAINMNTLDVIYKNSSNIIVEPIINDKMVLAKFYSESRRRELGNALNFNGKSRKIHLIHKDVRYTITVSADLNCADHRNDIKIEGPNMASGRGAIISPSQAFKLVKF